MSKKEIIKRYIIFLLGLFAMSMGISLMVKAKLGTSPISSIPYVISLKITSVSLGTFTFIWNMILIAGQIFILGKRFEKYQLMQIPISVLFGFFVDLCKGMLYFVDPKTYIGSVFVLILGCFTLALGVSFTVLAEVVLNSGKGFVKAITIRTGQEFGIMKVAFDVSLVIISIILGFVFFGKVTGVREGTVIAAVISGFIIRFFNRMLKPVINRWIAE